MGKKILDSKLLYALLAIVIAVALWFYVAITENGEADATIHDVPVVFLNQDLLEENGLMIEAGGEQTVSLTFMGSRSLLAELNQKRDELWVTVDVGKITGTGDQRMAFDVSYPSSGSSRFANGLTVIDRDPNNIYFTVSKQIKKEIEVRGKLVGAPAEGFMTDEFVIRPAVIEISGVETQVNQVSHALVTVRGDALDATVSGDMGFALISYQGEELTKLDLVYSTQTVSVTLPVLQTADIPMTVKFIPGGGASEEHVTYEISPTDTLTVAGEKEELAALKEIILGEVNLADVIGSNVYTFPIPLGQSINNISGISEATVAVRLTGLETKVLESDNIELINVPDNCKAESVTQSLQVLVRGPEQALTQVLSHHLRIVADLSSVNSAPGRYTVPAKVYLDGTGEVGVVGGDYKIVVTITR